MALAIVSHHSPRMRTSHLQRGTWVPAAPGTHPIGQRYRLDSVPSLAAHRLTPAKRAARFGPHWPSPWMSACADMTIDSRTPSSSPRSHTHLDRTPMSESPTRPVKIGPLAPRRTFIMLLKFIEGILTTLSEGPLNWLTYALVAGIIFAESGLFFGFFLPGDSLLIAAGIFAAQSKPLFNIWILVPLLFVAAVLGDNVGYWFGAKTGPKIFARDDSRFFKKKYLEAARDFYDKHGGKAVILARFTPFVRTFAPIVAGAVGMPYRRFMFNNLLGALLWAVGLTLVGYFFGNHPFVKDNLEIALVLVVLVSVLPIAVHYISDRRKAHKA